MFLKVKTMTTALESFFGGSLVDLAEKAGTRFHEAEQRIKDCEMKSESAIQNVKPLEMKIQTIVDLFDKLNSRFDVLENDVIAKINTRLDKLESIQRSKHTDKKELMSTETNSDTKKELVKESKIESKQVENVNNGDSKNREEGGKHLCVENDLLNKKVKDDKYLEQRKMKALRMLDELSVVSESR